MKRNILFAITIFLLNSTVTRAADLQNSSNENTTLVAPALSANVERLPRISVNRPVPLVFPKNFGSENVSSTLMSKVKLKTIQLGIYGKDVAMQIFTYENMHTLKGAVISIMVTSVFAISEFMKWVFDVLNSLRNAATASKPAEKID